MVPKSNVKVSTTEFEMSHGKKPRGCGNWAFFAYSDTARLNAFWHNGSFGDAKKAAVEHFRRRNVFDVVVGS